MTVHTSKMPKKKGVKIEIKTNKKERKKEKK